VRLQKEFPENRDVRAQRAYWFKKRPLPIICKFCTNVPTYPLTSSDDYVDDIQRLVDERKTANEIYETLALEDIRQAGDLLRPLYGRSDGRDGYVSLEVSPTLAHDTSGTVAQAKRLFAAVGRPNVMIKIPETPAGIPVIGSVIAAFCCYSSQVFASPALSAINLND